MKTENKKNGTKKRRIFFSIKNCRSVKIFHTVLGFRLIKLLEGVEDGNAGVITPSGFIINHPVVTYIINK